MTLPDFLTLPRDVLHALRLTIDAADDAVQHLPESTTITFHPGGRVVFDAALPTWPTGSVEAVPDLRPAVDPPETPLEPADGRTWQAVTSTEGPALPTGARVTADQKLHHSGSPFWTDEEDAQLLKMRGQGTSVRLIAEALGRPTPATHKRIKRLREIGVDMPAVPRSRSHPVVREAKAPTPTTLVQDAPIVQAAVAADPVEEPVVPAEVSVVPASMPVAPSRPVRSGPAPTNLGLLPSTSTMMQRELVRHLDAIPFDGAWGRDDDLALVEALTGGRKLPQTAEGLGFSERATSLRFAALSATIRDPRGRCTIDGQAALLAELRRRVAPVAQAAE